MENETEKWTYICREDRLPDGTKGPYKASRRDFASYEEASAYAEGTSTSRHPIVVMRSAAAAVVTALNGPTKVVVTRKGDRKTETFDAHVEGDPDAGAVWVGRTYAEAFGKLVRDLGATFGIQVFLKE